MSCDISFVGRNMPNRYMGGYLHFLVMARFSCFTGFWVYAIDSEGPNVGIELKSIRMTSIFLPVLDNHIVECGHC